MFTLPYQPISQSQHGSDVNWVTDTAGLNRGMATLALGVPASFHSLRETVSESKTVF